MSYSVVCVVMAGLHLHLLCDSSENRVCSERVSGYGWALWELLWYYQTFCCLIAAPFQAAFLFLMWFKSLFIFWMKDTLRTLVFIQFLLGFVYAGNLFFPEIKICIQKCKYSSINHLCVFFWCLLFSPIREYSNNCSQDPESYIRILIKLICHRRWKWHGQSQQAIPCGIPRFIWYHLNSANEPESWLRISLAVVPRCWKILSAESWTCLSVPGPNALWLTVTWKAAGKPESCVRGREFCRIYFCLSEFLDMHCEHQECQIIP